MSCGFCWWAWRNALATPFKRRHYQHLSPISTKIGTRVDRAHTHQKVRGTCGLNPTGSRQFWIPWSFLAFSTSCIWTNSSYRIAGIDFKLGVCELDYLVIKSYQKVFQILKGVSAFWRQSLTSRHETWNCYNLSINGQICTKLHIIDNSPSLSRGYSFHKRAWLNGLATPILNSTPHRTSHRYARKLVSTFMAPRRTKKSLAPIG